MLHASSYDGTCFPGERYTPNPNKTSKFNSGVGGRVSACAKGKTMSNGKVVSANIALGVSFYGDDLGDVWYQINGHTTVDGEESISIVAVGQLGREPAAFFSLELSNDEQKQRFVKAILRAVPPAWERLTGVIAGDLVAGEVIQ